MASALLACLLLAGSAGARDAATPPVTGWLTFGNGGAEAPAAESR